MDVEVIRSTRRRKTIHAVERDGVVRLSIPHTLSKAEEEHWTAVMVRRLQRRRDTSRIDVARRARQLADRFDLPRPASIRWATNQTSLWGSCTPVDGTIRVSARLAAYPRWVLDYVIVHELAHLRYYRHGPRFHALVDRYPLAERARGFLIAKGLEPEGDDDTEKFEG
ncbi:MAG: M48 family metallopeptidase [Acidimicrobiia bacterium]|nr:M48 family metallopeptidase [Acidimicrobiia bacterium]